MEEETRVDDNRVVSVGVLNVVDGHRALASLLARGVLRVSAKRTLVAEATCLSPGSKPCLDTVNTERSR